MADSLDAPPQGRGSDGRTLPTIGWREWIALPDLGIKGIKAKVDTGARTSTLHAYGVRVEEQDGVQIVHFRVYPVQRQRRGAIRVSAPLVGWKHVRSSSGHRTRRPVIHTTLEWMGDSWPIEITLSNRDEMGFRMLLGRQAVRRHAVVDPSRSFLDPRHRALARLNAAHIRSSRKQKTIQTSPIQTSP